MHVSNRLHLQWIGDDHPSHERRQHARNRHAVAGGLDDHLVRWQKTRAQAFKPSPSHVDPVDASKRAVLPNHHLAEGSVDIDADHPSHARLPVTNNGGSGERHDTHGFALLAQPGESQRRPATNTSSRLIE
jgi:hypothetical protein